MTADDMRTALKMLTDMANDLEAYTRAEYGWPDVHPAMKRKYERDIQDIEKARAFIDRMGWPA